MLSEHRMRRALYSATAVAYVACFGFAVLAVALDTLPARVGFMLTSVMAGALSTASLFMWFVAPLERVYRHGYQAGQRTPVQGVEQADDLRVVGERADVVSINRGRSSRAWSSNGFDSTSN